MRPSSVLAVLVLLASFAVDAQVLPGQQIVTRAVDPSIPPFGVTLKRSVVDVELQCKEGNKSISANGTGFAVAYTDPRLPKGLYFPYLATNRHVAECWEEPAHRPREVQSLVIRLNNKDGSSRRVAVDPRAWRFPADDSVDLAVMPISFPDGVQMDVIPVDDFATKDFMYKNRIAEGCPIILSGYFVQFPGQQSFQPIVRQGILSMIPDEPMKTTTGKPGTVYLGDVHIFLGNSGSPVMVAADALNLGGYHFLGVVSGYYYEDADFSLEIATTVKGTANTNSGIAMIVPADFLKALLDVPELKASREAYFTSQDKSAKK
jgi:hypothetical protein